ncbi:MAG: aldehyde dehydrogenase (NADP(+)), partial [Bacteroidota bacterium]
VGQFCTNPGLVVLPPSTRRDAFLDAVQSGTEQAGAGTMLHAGIRASYERRLAEIDALEGVERLATGREGTGSATPAQTVVFRTDADTFLAHPTLREEIFGPASLIVTCETGEHVQNVAAAVAGNLTATLHGTEDELLEHLDLIRLLERKVGRLSVGGFPTGVEVCEAMQHGGPYPATTDVRSTSVGTAAIERFVRPIAYQNVPASLLG